MKDQVAKLTAALLLVFVAVIAAVAISVTIATLVFYMSFTAYDLYFQGEYFWASLSAGIALMCFWASAYGGLGLFYRNKREG